MFLASGRVGVVRTSVLRKPNILCTEFLEVAGVEAWRDERTFARRFCDAV